MKKLFSVIALFIFFISSTNLKVVMAEEDITSSVTFIANVPDGFSANIMINLYCSNNTNINFSLSKQNGYEYTVFMNKGNYSLDFVSIYNDINNEYTHNLNQTLIVNEQFQTIEFNILENKVAKTDSNIKNSVNMSELTIEKIIGICLGVIMVARFLKKIK